MPSKRARLVVSALLAVVLSSTYLSAQNTVNLVWQQFLNAANTWIGTQTFTNVTVTGTCTGCSGTGAPIGAPYLVQTATGVGSLTNYFRLVAGSNITLTPGTNTLTIASSGGGGSGCVPGGSAGQILSDNGSGACTSNATGTGILTALGVNVGSAGAPVLFNGAGGTPSSLVLTNATGLVTAGINASQVTLAKIQNAGSNSVLLGAGAAGVGSPYAEIALGTNLSMSGTTLNAASGSAQVLPAYVSKTTNYTAVWGTDGTIECKTNAFTVTLPTAVGHSGTGFIVKNQQTTNTCTTATTSGQTIDGNSVVGVLLNSLIFISDGANWIQVASLGIALPTLNQGDLLYAPSANMLTNLARSTAPFAVVSNQGTSNNPAYSSTIPLPFEFNLPTGIVQAGTATATCSLPSSGAPTATAAASSTPLVGDLSFSGSALQTWECHFTIPHDWTASSTFDFRYTWRAASTTGNVAFDVKTGVVAAGSTLAGMSYSSATHCTSAAQGTTLQLQTCAATGVTVSGAAADGELFIQISRNGGTSPDTMSGAAELISVRVVLRRTITMGG